MKANKHGTYTVADSTGEVLDRNIPLDQLKVLPTPDDEPISQTDKKQRKKEEAPEREIESILSHRENDHGELEYLIHWKGLAKTRSTWTNENEFIDTAIIERYFRDQSVINSTKRKARVHSLSINTNNSRCFLLSSERVVMVFLARLNKSLFCFVLVCFISPDEHKCIKHLHQNRVKKKKKKKKKVWHVHIYICCAQGGMLCSELFRSVTNP